MTGRDIIILIAFLVLFLSGFIPIVMGIVYHLRENRRLDREERERTRKAASQGA